MSGLREGERIALGREPDFAIAGLSFQPATRQLFVNGTAETLEPRVMQVLALLARRRGEVVSRDELVERCWEGRAVSEDAINRSIAKVRRIAEAHGGFDLETIPRVGYRLKEEGARTETRSRRRRRPWMAPAALLMLAAAALGLWLTVLRPGPAPAEPTSLAVLPFRNLAPGDDYFAEGMAEEILTQLARQPGLRVAGRTSSWLFRDNANLRDVGRRLDVAYVLEGSVRRAGRQVRVDVALVDTRDGMRRWSQNFQGSLDDVFAIQSQIGNAVAGNLRRQIVLSAPPPRPVSTRGDVHLLYLTARGLMRERTPVKLETAISLLRRTVQLDRDYAPAWSSLAVALHLYPFYANPDDAERASMEREKLAAARRALALAPDQSETHAAFGLVHGYDREGIAHLLRAVRLDPNNAEAWYWLYQARSEQLDFEGALQAVRRSAEIDPFWTLIYAYPNLAFNMGERDEAMRFLRRLAASHPDAFQRSLARWTIAYDNNDLSGALRAAHEGSQLAPADAAEFARRREAAVLIRLGRFEEAWRLVDPPGLFRTMTEGRVPPPAELQAAPPNLANFWSWDEMRLLLPRLLLNSGRGRELVRLYDMAYRSPEDMAAHHPGGVANFIEDVPNVAIALREAGRSAEADRLLGLASRNIDAALRRGRVPLRFRANIAAVRAVQGRRDEALAVLAQSIREGWRWQSTTAAVPLAQQPAFRALQSDPRLQHWDRMMQAELARERREALAERT